jgi:hypothetical protein
MVSMRGKLVCLEGPSVCSPRCCQEGALLIIGIRLYLLQMFRLDKKFQLFRGNWKLSQDGAQRILEYKSILQARVI